MSVVFVYVFSGLQGATAGLLVAHGYTGMMATVQNLCEPVSQWKCGGGEMLLRLRVALI